MTGVQTCALPIYDDNAGDSQAFHAFAENFRQTHAAGGGRTSSNINNSQTTITVSGVSDPRQAAAIVASKMNNDTVAPGNFAPAGGQ